MSYDHKTTLATIQLLAETLPQCFAVFEQRRRPLKLGIYNDVMAALGSAITAKELSAAMRVYCGNRFYLRASTEGAPRVDLNGGPCGRSALKKRPTPSSG
jgi:ProP effector